jgi:hypothetical protein
MDYSAIMERSRRTRGQERPPGPGMLRRIVAEHAVSSALLALFALSLLGQSIAGFLTQPPAARAHALLAYAQYLVSGDFLETVAENWEGEFLPLASYVLLTSLLHEKGAKESRQKGRGAEDTDRTTGKSGDAGMDRQRRDLPWPERVGGPLRWLYEHSLFLMFLLIFLLAVTLHAITGIGAYNGTRVEHGLHPVSILGYLGSDVFWLQSLRNWQAGFLSTALLVLFSIFLRERGSPVSKTPLQRSSETAEEGKERRPGPE